MAHQVNGARGEVLLSIEGEEVVLAATMGGLAAVSTQLGCKSVHDLFTRLSGAEVAAATAAIPALTIKGDPEKVLAKLKLKHFPMIAEAFAKALAHHFEDDEGNDPAAKEVK